MAVDASISYISDRLERLPLINEHKFAINKYTTDNFSNIFNLSAKYSPSVSFTNESSSTDNVLFFGDQFNYWSTACEPKFTSKLQDDSKENRIKTVAPISFSANLPVNYKGSKTCVNNTSVDAIKNEKMNKLQKINIEENELVGLCLDQTSLKPTFSALSPIKSKASPNKRKRSSDSFGMESSPYTKSCDLEVSNISCSDNLNIKRTLSFDEELLSINKKTIWSNKSPTFSRCSPKSNYIKRNRPSINIERQGCRSQPSYFREFGNKGNNTRKIQVLHNDSLKNKLITRCDTITLLNTDKRSICMKTNIDCEHVFKPIKDNR